MKRFSKILSVCLMVVNPVLTPFVIGLTMSISGWFLLISPIYLGLSLMFFNYVHKEELITMTKQHKLLRDKTKYELIERDEYGDYEIYKELTTGKQIIY